MQQILPNQLVHLLQRSLDKQGVSYERVIERLGQVCASKDCEHGKEFALSDHVRGLLLSLLSNQTPFRRIEENLERFHSILFGYDPVKIKQADRSQIEKSLRHIQCGNRRIHKQIAVLRENMETLERIDEEYGSLDKFVTSANPEQIAKRLSDGRHMLKEVGFTLALEHLRNVGIRAPKPDKHIRRIIGGERLGFVMGEPSEEEAYDVMVRLADEAGVNRTYLDNLLWLFCAKYYGDICGAAPRCGACLLSPYCAYPEARA